MTKQAQQLQRGAFAVMAGILMMVLAMIAGLAVDLGTFYGQASDLQSAADAASLAGAIEQQRTGSPTAVNAEVDRVLRANGVDTSDPTVVVTVAINPAGEVQVDLSDTDVDLFFSSVVLNNMQIDRTATAFLDDCGATCVQDLVIAPPFSSIEVAGTGDGWTPILVGNRVFGINHHTGPGANIICADRATEATCAGYPRPLGSAAGAADFYTGNVPGGVTYGDRIFFVGQTTTDFGVGCWNTITDQNCPMLNLASLPLGQITHFTQRGGGMTLVSDEIYLIDDHHYMHCVNAAAMSVCPGYPRHTQLGIDGVYPTLDGAEVGGFRSAVFHNNKYYVTIPSRTLTNPSKLLCWDIVANGECAGFGGADGTVDLSNSSMYVGLRLFLRKDNSGNVTGVCNLLDASHECFNITSGASTGTVAGLDAALLTRAGHIGEPYMAYDRTYFNAGYLTSGNDCWDWLTSTHCGRLIGNVAGAATEDYGYVHEGDCIFALGDESIFWTFDINMNVGCRSGTAETTISPCICGDGTAHWGQVTINGDLRSVSGPFVQFSVRVSAPDGTTLILQDMLDGDGTLDLETIPTTYTSLTISITLEAKVGQDPWASGQIPTIQVGWRDQPYLTN